MTNRDRQGLRREKDDGIGAVRTSIIGSSDCSIPSASLTRQKRSFFCASSLCHALSIVSTPSSTSLRSSGQGFDGSLESRLRQRVRLEAESPAPASIRRQFLHQEAASSSQPPPCPGARPCRGSSGSGRPVAHPSCYEHERIDAEVGARWQNCPRRDRGHAAGMWGACHELLELRRLGRVRRALRDRDEQVTNSSLVETGKNFSELITMSVSLPSGR